MVACSGEKNSPSSDSIQQRPETAEKKRCQIVSLTRHSSAPLTCLTKLQILTERFVCLGGDVSDRAQVLPAGRQPTGESTTESILIYTPEVRVVYRTPVPPVRVLCNTLDVYAYSDVYNGYY